MISKKKDVTTSLDIFKNEHEAINKIVIAETSKDYNEDKTMTSTFFYRIKKECNHITHLSLVDADVFTSIKIEHENEIDYEKSKEGWIKHDLAFRLCGHSLENHHNLSKEELSKVIDVLKNIETLTEEEYETFIKEDKK